MIAPSVQLAFRIAFTWALGFLIAAGVRAVLPDHLGFTLASGKGTLFIPFSRVGFWTCVLASLTVSAWVVIAAMMVDVGLRSLR